MGATTKKNVASGGSIKTVVIKESELKLSPSNVTENAGTTQHSLE